MQQQTGQFVYLNGGPARQQPVGQNVVVMAPGQQPQQQFVVLAPAQTPMQVQNSGVADPYKGYNRKTSKIMGAMQICLAVLMIGLNIGMAVADDNSLWVIGTGWWATPFMIMAGAFGFAAATQPNRCKVANTMLFSILSCVFMISVFIQAGLAIPERKTECGLNCENGQCYSYCRRFQPGSNIALYAVFILAGLTELGVGITQAIICCKVLCCGNPTPQTYVSNHGQNYANGGFVPCYVHPQGGAIGQSIPMSNVQNMQQFAMPANVSMPANTVAMQTNIAMPTNETSNELPPAYSKE